MTLLKSFTDERPHWALADLAAAAGLNKSTTFRLLTALESEGMVARYQDGEQYVLGPEIVVMGGRALRGNDLRRIARPALEEMAAATGETATLEILAGGDILIIDEVVGEHLTSSTQSLGTRWPVYATSTGLAILAHLPPERVERLLSRPLRPFTPQTIISVAVLRDELAAVRRRGYAINDEALETGLRVVGAPLFNFEGQPLAAVSLGAPTVRFTPERIPSWGALVCQTAARLSRQMGYEAATAVSPISAKPS